MSEEIKPIVESQVQPEPLKLVQGTTFLRSDPPDYDDISIFKGVSLRGVITFIVISTVCAASLLKIPIEETVKAIAFVCLGFYFKSGK